MKRKPPEQLPGSKEDLTRKQLLLRRKEPTEMLIRLLERQRGQKRKLKKKLPTKMEPKVTQ